MQGSLARRPSPGAASVIRALEGSRMGRDYLAGPDVRGGRKVKRGRPGGVAVQKCGTSCRRERVRGHGAMERDKTTSAG